MRAVITLVCVASFAFFGSHADADFKFDCKKAKSKDECIQEFKAFDKSCCFADQRSDRKFKDVSKPSDFCQVNENNTTCASSSFYVPPKWSCKVRSTVCGPVSQMVGFSDPPSYSCENKDDLVVFSEVLVKVGMDFENKQKLVRTPIFCISKESGETSKTKKANKVQ